MLSELIGVGTWLGTQVPDSRAGDASTSTSLGVFRMVRAVERWSRLLGLGLGAW